MVKGKCNWPHRYTLFVSLIAGLLCLFSLSSCGRKADPVYVPEYEQKEAVESGNAIVEEGATGPAVKEGSADAAEAETARPDAPAGLTALFTGNSIILTWDEVQGQAVVSYNIYRLSDSGYLLAGESSTPAFVDRDIEKNREYVYKVRAVGKTEGPESESIRVSTDAR